MSLKKVLYISQEITPYLKPDVMSTLGQMVPQCMIEKGLEVRTFMPRYACINERRNQLHEVIRLSGVNIVIDDNDHPLIIKVATLQPSRMQVYFIDNDDYFLRQRAEDLEINTMPEENDERCIFFVRGVIETVRKLRWESGIIHCSGWITALAPLYIKHSYAEDPSFVGAKMVYSLFGNGFNGTLDPRFREKLKMEGFDDELLKTLGTEAVDFKTLNKFAIDHADAIIQATDDVDPELVEYAKASGKPFMPYPGAENYADAYYNFYASLEA